jgi:L-rhamnose mutarotase
MNGYLKTTQLPVYKRYCKVLKLQENKELIEKYKEIHKPENIWPVISKGIKEVGIIDMEIYIKDNMAFMIMDTVPDFDHDKAMKKLGSLPKQKEWEEYVSQFQNAGSKADTPEKWEIVERIFALEGKMEAIN